MKTEVQAQSTVAAQPLASLQQNTVTLLSQYFASDDLLCWVADLATLSASMTCGCQTSALGSSTGCGGPSTACRSTEAEVLQQHLLLYPNISYH